MPKKQCPLIIINFFFNLQCKVRFERTLRPRFPVSTALYLSSSHQLTNSQFANVLNAFRPTFIKLFILGDICFGRMNGRGDEKKLISESSSQPIQLAMLLDLVLPIQTHKNTFKRMVESLAFDWLCGACIFSSLTNIYEVFVAICD